ncbi:hypothetical protein [Nocardia lasii]|uniref:Uncharacterized protein n=1 Tax=Nocardia lasii TaxID=1616107 RepID=A0ABW1JQC7_9NOCA
MSTEVLFPQLISGWARATLDSSGAGVGVVARSANWPDELGRTARELGPMVTLVADAAQPFAFEFTLGRGVAVVGVKSPSRARPGTCVSHLVAGDPAVLDGYTALQLYAAEVFVRELSSEDPMTPTDRLAPLIWSGRAPGFADTVAAIVDRGWLPALIDAVLAQADSGGPDLELCVAGLAEGIAMLRAVYEVLPRALLGELTFAAGATPVPPSGSGPIIVVSVRPARASDSGRRRICPDEPGAPAGLGATIVRAWKTGVALPDRLDSVGDIQRWLDRRALRRLDPTTLDARQLRLVLTDPDLPTQWRDQEGVVGAILTAALADSVPADVLSRFVAAPPLRERVERDLNAGIDSGRYGREHARTIGTRLGLDTATLLGRAISATLDRGAPISTTDAVDVWPLLIHQWNLDGAPRRRVGDHLRTHPVLRVHAVRAGSDSLFEAGVRAELDDPRTSAPSTVLAEAVSTQPRRTVDLLVQRATGSRSTRAILGPDLDLVLRSAPSPSIARLVTDIAVRGRWHPTAVLALVSELDLAAPDLAAALALLLAQASVPHAIATAIDLDPTARDLSIPTKYSAPQHIQWLETARVWTIGSRSPATEVETDAALDDLLARDQPPSWRRLRRIRAAGTTALADAMTAELIEKWPPLWPRAVSCGDYVLFAAGLRAASKSRDAVRRARIVNRAAGSRLDWTARVLADPPDPSGLTTALAGLRGRHRATLLALCSDAGMPPESLLRGVADLNQPPPALRSALQPTLARVLEQLDIPPRLARRMRIRPR